MTAILYTILSENDSFMVKVMRSLEKFTGIQCVTADQAIVGERHSEDIVVMASTVVIDTWDSAARAALFERAAMGSIKLILVAAGTVSVEEEAGRMVFSEKDEDASILQELSGTTLSVSMRIRHTSQRITQTTKDWPHRLLIHYEATSRATVDILRVYARGKEKIFSLLPIDCQLITKDESNVTLPNTLPLLVCLKHHYGDLCWHRNVNHANLTIDDPWLREPYGFITYSKLLERMKAANFHTTIAFVPWNYDRSRKDVVDIFLRNEEYFSIAIHGNNHDHYEFRGYDEVSLDEQLKNVHQAVRRMEMFTKLTTIPHDKVMVFPQYICPEKTIEVLKESNFMASANCTTIPLGSHMKDDTEHALMPSVTEYYGFPLLKRYHPDIDKNIINITLFLRRPMLIYIHHYYFEKSMEEFDGLSRYINEKSRARLKWASLGKVSEGLYMERVVGANTREVKMLSKRILIENSQNMNVSYLINTSALHMADCHTLHINEKAYRTKSSIMRILEEPIEVPENKYLRVEALFMMKKGSVDNGIRRKSLVVNATRLLSDIRDNVVYKTKLLRRIMIR